MGIIFSSITGYIVFSNIIGCRPVINNNWSFRFFGLSVATVFSSSLPNRFPALVIYLADNPATCRCSIN